jgi:hypothetical protein
MQTAFPEESYTPLDSSCQAGRIATLEALRSELYRQDGSRCNRLYSAFATQINAAQTARAYPQVPIDNHTTPFTPFSAEIAKSLLSAGLAWTRQSQAHGPPDPGR